MSSELGGFFRRLARLHRLLWMDERVSALETREKRRQIKALQHQVEALQEQQKLTMRFTERSLDQVDLVLCSLSVPEELIHEFHEWKARNPVPERPLVSVTVATYNRARLLTKRCIPSVLNQTYEGLELIVVGDGCFDETEEAVAKIQDPRLRFVNLPQRGSYPADDPARKWMVAGTSALNEGLSMARGDYITHLDDDDEYLPDRLEKLVGLAVEKGCDLVWHPFWYEDGEGRWRINKSLKFARERVTTSSVLYRSWFKKIAWDVKAHLLLEPGDWNRFRRIKYVGPVSVRYPEPLLRHYRERSQGR